MRDLPRENGLRGRFAPAIDEATIPASLVLPRAGVLPDLPSQRLHRVAVPGFAREMEPPLERFAG